MATQQARNRRAGAEWETRLLHKLRDTGYDIERLHLNGREDEGDLILTTGHKTYIIEAKAGQPHLAQFVKQASREARNYETHRNKHNNSTIGLVVMKQRNKPWSEAYVVSTLNELLPHL
ncbi:holliday junction resolvase [Propionibacterium phage Procrass1]|uniref:Holliday junction resolvase n=1 Tax=Propionibacterium phage Procrass1 TaxID=1655019 RepID=A0A0H4IM86_9CAUD|nr:holliday junction resolvase [Propionibacterium phage Procrass1]AKO60261.1 holliday junction resolvase [Propionibacterium phage Procrass1]